MANKLCGDDVCDMMRCPTDPFHCEHFLLIIAEEAEMERDAEREMVMREERDEVVDDPFGDKPVGFR